MTNAAFIELMRFEVDRARSFLRSGLPLIETVPAWLQVDIDLFVGGGLKILDRVEQIGYEVWQVRPELSKLDFLCLFLGSAWRRLSRRISARDGCAR
jgi:phytoene/squalene synthetase